ncbi:MAG TPA: hypothetical protein VF006_20590 [Longimicrobium sp.]
MSNATVSEWMVTLNRNLLLGEQDLFFQTEYDKTKLARLRLLNEKIGLPINQPVSVEGNKFVRDNPIIREYFSLHRDCLFSIRAIPKDRSIGVTIQRSHGLSEDESFRFVEQLPGRSNSYTIQLNDYFVPDLSAIMVVNKHGILIEATKAMLMALTQQWLERTEIIHARLAFPGHSMTYTTDLIDIRRILWTAVKIVIPRHARAISPHNLPRVIFGYYEFVFSARYGYRFVDFNRTKLFSSSLPSVPETSPEWLCEPEEFDWLKTLERLE